MSETRPLPSSDEHSETSTWDVASLAQALNTTPQAIDDSPFGQGWRFVVGEGSAPSLDLYPAAGVLRLVLENTEVTLHSLAPPIVGAEQLIFEPVQAGTVLRHLSVTRRGEVTLLLVPLAETPDLTFRRTTLREGVADEEAYLPSLPAGESPQCTLSAERSFGDRPHATTIPPELAEFLRHQDYVCLTETTDRGTVLIIKVPTADIASVRGPVPILLRQDLYRHPAAPVIRLLVTIFDQPARPLALETFINVADLHQRANYAALTTQTELPLLFYDEALMHQLSKVVPFRQQQEVAAILSVAERSLGSIPQEEFNFDLAKAGVVQATQL
jgi:hypothetical protein